jgi:putative FmdB family regulatory protein
MPTYEFRCPDGHEFERFYRKMSDATPEVACPECGKLAVRLLSGGAGLVFKGSGFYLTDYGKNAHRKAEPASIESKGGDTSGDGKGESKSDGKPVDAKGGDATDGEKTRGDKTSGQKASAENTSGEKATAAAKPAESKSSEAKSSSSTKSEK